MRKSGKFLRSFGKQWEAELPTFLLTINEVRKKCAKRKKCEVGSNSLSDSRKREVAVSRLNLLRYPDPVESLAEKSRRLNYEIRMPFDGAQDDRGYFFSWQSSISTPLVVFGWRKQTSLLSAPFLGVSLSSSNPSAASRFISASMFSTSNATW